MMSNMNFASDQMGEPALAIRTSCMSPISTKLATKRQQLADKPTITSTTSTTTSEKRQDQLEREDDAQVGDKTCCKENQNKEKHERVSLNINLTMLTQLFVPIKVNLTSSQPL